MFLSRLSTNFNYRGNWNNTTAYSANDAVRSPISRMLYVATASVTGGADPGTAGGPASPWASPFAGILAEGPAGAMGTAGSNGDSIAVYFQENATRPAVGGESYSGGVFTAPTGFVQTVPDNPTEPIWMVIFRLNGDGLNYTELGLTRLSGIAGSDGQRGAVGQRGATGNTGAAGMDGTDGLNGASSRVIFRKSVEYELTQAPNVTFDGTTITLPSDDMHAWSLTPYSSKLNATWALRGTGNNAPDHGNITAESIDVDTSVQPNIVYVLDSNDHGDASVGGYVYRYSTEGAYMDRWPLVAANDTAVDIDVQGSYVRVLDGRTRGSQRVYVYNKEDGGRQSAEEFIVPDASVAVAQTISTNSSSIYLTSVDRVRRFNLSDNIEQTTGGLTGLTINPVGSDINDYYMFIVDELTDRVIVRDINTLSLRHTIREWPVSLASAQGIGVGEFEVFIVNSNTVYKYYNPDNILWGSSIFYQNEAPYTVLTTTPFDMTGQRGSGGGVIVQGAGTGSNGDSVRLIFREVATGSPVPATPSTNQGHYSAGSYTTPPSGWHLTANEAVTDFSGVGDLYASVVYLSGNGNTILRYETPFKTTGPQGPRGNDGAAAASGNSVEFIYRAATSEPSAPTGGTFLAATRTFTPPSGWTLNPPASVPSNQNLYLVEAILPGQGTDGGGTITYRTPFTAPRGAKGDTGDTGPGGAASTTPGPAGVAGEGFKIIFREQATQPTLPTGGSWNGTTFRPPSGWLLHSPTRTENDPENLYAVIVDLPGGGGTPIYNNVFRLNGTKGDKGDTGDQGIRGVGSDWIFLESSTVPDRPADGSGLWNSVTGAYTPPSGWSIEPGTYTGNQHLYAVNVDLPGNSNEETYSAVIRLDGPAGRTGPRGPAGTGTGGGLNNGDSIQAVYKRSNNDRDSSILAESLSGGTWDHTMRDFSAAPGTWSTTIPDAATGRYLYASIATLSGNSNTVDYSRVFQWSGSQGERGMAGTDGADSTVPGPAGARGASNIYLYGVGVTTPATIRGQTQGTYNPLTNQLTNQPSPTVWHTTPQTPTGTEREWVTIATAVPSGATFNLSYSDPIPFSGAQGPRGQQGAAGGAGAGSGSSVLAIYRRSQDPPANPTGGSWNHMTNVFTPPANWSETEQQGIGAGTLYVALVRVSGSTNDILNYTNAIRFEGPQGIQGPVGPVSTVPGPKGDKGDTGGRGPRGNDGKTFIPIFNWSVNRPADPTPDRFDGTLIHGLSSGWHQAPQETRPSNLPNANLWQANIEVNGSNVSVYSIFELPAGPAGPASTVAGPTGPAGTSFDIVYRRSSTALTVPPTGGTASNGELTSVPTGWSASVPGGTDPLYISIARIDGTTITYDEPVSLQGPAGEDGESIAYFFQRTSTDSAPTQPAIIFNGTAFSGFGSWNMNNSGGTGNYLWVVIVFYQNGQAGQRVSNVIPFNGQPGTNAPQVQYQYSDTGTGGWGAYGANSVYFRTSVDGGTTWSDSRRFRGQDGQDGTNGTNGNDGTDGTNGTDGRNADVSLPIFQLNSSESPARPSVLGTWNGTDYDPPSGWFETPPTSTQTQYTVAQWLKLSGNAPFTITPLGNPLLVALRLPTTPPVTPSRSTYSNGFEYGLASGNNPSSTIENSAAFSLAVNETHTTPNLDFPTTTAANTNFFIRLPAGLTLVSARESVDGDVTTLWNRVGSTQVWIYTIGFANSNNLFSFTVRRDT